MPTPHHNELLIQISPAVFDFVSARFYSKIKPYSIAMKTVKPKVQLLDYCEIELFRSFTSYIE